MKSQALTQLSQKSPLFSSALCAFLTVNLGLRLALIYRLNFNWDEFHYLSWIHDYLASRPLPVLQTFHVHLFSWLPGLGGASEPDQLMVARMLLLALSILSGLLIFLIGKRVLSVPAALLAALSYFSFSEVMVHGAAFRPDPMAAFLGLAAVWLGCRSSHRMASSIAAGLLIGISIPLSTKSVLLVPSLAVLLLLRPDKRCGIGRRVLALALLSLAGAAVAIPLSVWHRSTLAPANWGGISMSGLGWVLQKVFGNSTFFPRRGYFLRSLVENPLIWLLLLGGFLIALKLVFSRDDRKRQKAVTLLALTIPLFSILFYRNAFPYFYVFVLATAALLAGLVVDQLEQLRASEKLRRMLLWLLAIAVFSTGIRHFDEHRRPMQASQRQVISTVHRMFPEPVPYIDRCSMIPSFPKVGFFMSSWGMENYRSGLHPPLAAVVRKDQPVFLLANTALLDLTLPEQLATRLRFRLTSHDRQTLRANYVHHWGIIFVAGKSLDFTHTEELEFETLIPGPYTLEAQESLYVDGQRLAPGQSTYLGPGSHVAKASTATRAVLRWGEQLYRPPEAPIGMPIFVSF